MGHGVFDKIVRAVYGTPVNRYFRWGARYLAKVPSAFCREITLEQTMDYVQSCKVQGDYAEFGVYKGRTFAAACFLGRERRLTMRFWAFDSFAGLPDSEGEFRKGQFECAREEFLRIVRRCVGHIADVHVVPGWFSDTLSPENQSISALKAVAIAWIDCDLYESTKPVLVFLTERLSHGSVICFDDWFNIKARPDCGEQKACQEWLTRNPQLRLTPYSRFGWHGQSFIVHHVS